MENDPRNWEIYGTYFKVNKVVWIKEENFTWNVLEALITSLNNLAVSHYSLTS